MFVFVTSEMVLGGLCKWKQIVTKDVGIRASWAPLRIWGVYSASENGLIFGAVLCFNVSVKGR